MDFFQAQENARSASRRLVLWFALCVVAVVAVIYVLAAMAKPMLIDERGRSAGVEWWDLQLLSIIAPTIGGIIVLGSLFKLLQLSSGGAVVARDLGGRPVDPGTRDPLERRLLNIVEEMSIASGIPAPEVWVLDGEEGINAFAAGTDLSNAVVGVTRGSLERLTRAELQGVIAHEFSHILNGDMKLNMRLIGWIFGLIMIAMLGRMLLELLRFSRGSRDSRGNGGMLAVVAAGVALWLVGSIGVFFARLLQAAVSRQREFLADASAVQFTRNPSGLADALKKVGGFARSGALHTPKAAEARHLFFAKSDFAGLGFATHPPLEDRIKAIDPAWNGAMLKGRPQEVFADDDREGMSSRLVPPPLPTGAGFAAPSRDAPAAERVAGSGIGSKTDAKALMLGLLLPQDDAGALKRLRQQTSEEMASHAASWAALSANHSAREKLAWVDGSLPWLRRMGREEAAEFLKVTRGLIEFDGQVDLMEFMLQKVLERHVGVALGLRRVPRIRHQSLAALGNEAAVLIDALARISGDPQARSAAAAEFRQHTGSDLPVMAEGGGRLAAVAKALAEFEAATPLVKVQVLRMCGRVVSHDGMVDERELQLLRAAAEAMGAPMPPLETQDSAIQ
jgi:Zn-dependent protease with chaperone function